MRTLKHSRRPRRKASASHRSWLQSLASSPVASLLTRFFANLTWHGIMELLSHWHWL